jgi:hypothetical protein
MRILARLLPWLVLVLAAPLAAQSPSPTPRDWQQWQPQTDRSDARLEARAVTVWRDEITVEELLAAMQAASGVELLATAEALPVHLSVFAEQRSVEGLMTALGASLDGYWVFPRGAEGARRSYCLVLRRSATGSPEAQNEEHWARIQRALTEAQRPAREARLALYRQALKLSPEELLARYQETDPWLCADLLRPGGRPLLGYVLSLPADQEHRLLHDGELVIRMQTLAPSLRDYLSQWWHDESLVRGVGGSASYLWRSDGPRTGFICQDEWAASYVRLSWTYDGLVLQLGVPGTGDRQLRLVRMPQLSASDALDDLLAFGYAKSTPEYQERLRRASEAHEQAIMHPEDDPGTAAFYSVGPAPNLADPRLETVIPLDDASGTLSSADVFARAARRCQVAALAVYLPPDAVHIGLPEPRSRQMMLRDLLGQIRQHRPATFSWDFYGQYLVGTDESYRVTQAAMLPPEVRAKWEQWVRSGVTLSLDQFAAALSGLNELQLNQMYMAFPESDPIGTGPLANLRLYGRLTDEQRARLSKAGGLPLAELPAEQQDAYARYTRGWVPWAQAGDLDGAVLRAVPVTLPGGVPGLSLVLEYHFPDLPGARYVAFAQPLTITIPPTPAPPTYP